jgi:anti-sigma factor RsiW
MKGKESFQCNFSEEALNAYLDGETTPKEKAAVEAHLSRCSECMKTLQELKAAKSFLKSLAPMKAPETLWGKLEAQLQKECHVVPLKLRVKKVLRWIEAVAAVVVFFFTTITLIGMLSPSNVSAENLYIASRAYHVSRFPLTDHASWNYLTEEASFAFINQEE